MLARYRDLADKVDAFFARVATRHASDLVCASGCDMCCQVRLTITGVEAAAIASWASTIPADQRSAIAEAARAANPTVARCAALDEAGRCRIYAARPLVCRSHGLPIRQRHPGSLPVIESCSLTFRTHGPATADADCVLDQELVSATLGVIDRAHASESGQPLARIDLGELLGGLGRSPMDLADSSGRSL